MQLQLHLHTAPNDTAPLDLGLALQEVYAFLPYRFTHIGNGVLETIIDAAHDLTPDQLAVIAANKYEVTFVLPAASASALAGVPPPTLPVSSPVAPPPLTA